MMWPKQFARPVFAVVTAFANAAAAGGVGQHGDVKLADQRPERVPGLAAGRFAPQRQP